MSEVKHTHGEWEIHSLESGNGNEIIIMGGAQINICELHEYEYTGESEIYVSNEFKANAKLIAAAPTMYDYILSKADAGDEQAKQIINSI